MRRLLATVAPLVLAATLLAALWLVTEPEPGSSTASHATHGDFTVRTASGARSLSSLRGRVVVVYFGYTSCPDVCPTTLAALSSAFARLDPGQRARATALFVSVDPMRDTVRRLAKYVGYFDPSFIAGTAGPETLRAIADDWGVAYAYTPIDDSRLGYAVDHSTQAFVIDPRGRLVETLRHGTPPAEIAAAIRRHLPEAHDSKTSGAQKATDRERGAQGAQHEAGQDERR